MSEKPFTIFAVEDDDWYRKLLHHNLTLNPDYSVETFADGQTFLDALYKKPNVVTLDFRLPDFDGEKLLKKIKQ
ncbi:MAG: DNA-binding NtrC family response regulator, partial [Marinoscillum sp.]